MSRSSSVGSTPDPRPSTLSAHDVHDRLMTALTELRRAEQNAVLWFAEVLRRKLYRQLGYGSIQQYATEALGFSTGKTHQFIRLSESLRSLPELERAVARGEVSWTKAREVAAVATPSTESRWIEVARTSSRRDLERRIARAKGETRLARRRDPAQRTIVGSSSPVSGGGLAGARPGGAASGSSADGAEVETHGETDRAPSASPSPTPSSTPPAVAATVQLRFSPEQLARFEGLVEAARKQGHRSSREELVLGGLEAMVSERPAASDGSAMPRSERATPTPAKSATPPRIHRSPYQVVVYRCESCGQGHVPTSRGNRPLDLATLRTIVCDADMVGRGKRLRATIYPGKRRAVLERDRHRCQAAGCRNTRFLHVHHLVPLEFGGTDDLKNLVTLCRECHRWVHERHERLEITGEKTADGAFMPRALGAAAGPTPPAD